MAVSRLGFVSARQETEQGHNREQAAHAERAQEQAARDASRTLPPPRCLVSVGRPIEHSNEGKPRQFNSADRLFLSRRSKPARSVSVGQGGGGQLQDGWGRQGLMGAGLGMGRHLR